MIKNMSDYIISPEKLFDLLPAETFNIQMTLDNIRHYDGRNSATFEHVKYPLYAMLNAWHTIATEGWVKLNGDSYAKKSSPGYQFVYQPPYEKEEDIDKIISM